MEECIITKTFICPHKEINGKKCTYCKVVDLHLNTKETKSTYTIEHAEKFEEALNNIYKKADPVSESINIINVLNQM